MKTRLLICLAALFSVSAVATDPLDRTIAHLNAVSDDIMLARERVLGSAEMIPERRAMFEAEAAGMVRANEIVQQRISALVAARDSGR